jgi:hypothetical protein
VIQDTLNPVTRNSGNFAIGSCFDAGTGGELSAHPRSERVLGKSRLRPVTFRIFSEFIS